MQLISLQGTPALHPPLEGGYHSYMPILMLQPRTGELNKQRESNY